MLTWGCSRMSEYLPLTQSTPNVADTAGRLSSQTQRLACLFSSSNSVMYLSIICTCYCSTYRVTHCKKFTFICSVYIWRIQHDCSHARKPIFLRCKNICRCISQCTMLQRSDLTSAEQSRYSSLMLWLLIEQWGCALCLTYLWLIVMSYYNRSELKWQRRGIGNRLRVVISQLLQHKASPHQSLKTLQD